MRSAAFLNGEDPADVPTVARESLDFFQKTFQDQLATLLPQGGNEVADSLSFAFATGAPTSAFLAATKREMARKSGGAAAQAAP